MSDLRPEQSEPQTHSPCGCRGEQGTAAQWAVPGVQGCCTLTWAGPTPGAQADAANSTTRTHAGSSCAARPRGGPGWEQALARPTAALGPRHRPSAPAPPRSPSGPCATSVTKVGRDSPPSTLLAGPPGAASLCGGLLHTLGSLCAPRAGTSPCFLQKADAATPSEMPPPRPATSTGATGATGATGRDARATAGLPVADVDSGHSGRFPDGFVISVRRVPTRLLPLARSWAAPDTDERPPFNRVPRAQPGRAQVTPPGESTVRCPPQLSHLFCHSCPAVHAVNPPQSTRRARVP